jgi:hypothetical protein
MNRVIVAALVGALAPIAASAATVPAALPPAVNDLAANDYFDSFSSSFPGDFSLNFESSDADRNVTARLELSADLPTDAAAGFSTGDAFTLGSGIVSIDETITFMVMAGDMFTFDFEDGATLIAKDFDYTLTVTSVAKAPPVPVPAALPLIATGLAALGFVGARRRKG